MRSLFLIMTFLCIQSLSAQVEDISFTLTPSTEYVLWDDQAGLSDDFLYGGKIGFGFGEYLELRGVFQTSTNLQTDFASFGLENFSDATFEVQNVNLQRYGGELKVNLSKGKFSPYLTLGTGIQSLELNDNEFEQIYAGFGLGLRLAFSDRINLLIEGKANSFNLDSANNLLSPANQSQYNVNTTDFSEETTLNLGLSAALQIYLGGRKPGELSTLDKAYLKKYNGGFKGWSWVFEPSLAYLNFDSDSFYRNTWMTGGYFGVDFTDFVGLRAYYLQAMEDETISSEFDDLNTYGLEFRAKLNNGKGVKPYLIFGGGYIDVASDYSGTLEGFGAQSSGFANAGLGLDIPLGRNVLITGGVRLMANSSREISNPTGPDALQVHEMYTAGIKIQIGKKQTTPEADSENKTQTLDPIKTETPEQNREDYNRIIKLENEYQQVLKQIDENIKKAYQQKNTQIAIDLLEDKKRISEELRDVQKIKRIYKQKGIKGEGEYLKMTPEEFENLIDRILEGIDEKYKKADEIRKSSNEEEVDIEGLILKIIELREKIDEENKDTNQAAENNQIKNEKISEKDSLKSNSKAEKELALIIEDNLGKQKEINERMNELNSQIEEFSKQLQSQQKDLKKAQKEKATAEKKAAEAQKAKEKMEIEKKEAEKELKALEKKTKEESKKKNEKTSQEENK